MKIRSVLLGLFGTICITLVGCSDPPVSTTDVTFQISSEGDFSINGTRLDYPISQSALESLIGPPSRTKNTPSHRNLVWDNLGFMTVHKPSPTGTLLKINFRLEGQFSDPDINPSRRFNGSIEVPAGTLNLNVPNIETDGYGFKELMGDNSVVTMDIGGVEVMLAGRPFRREFGHIAFLE